MKPGLLANLTYETWEAGGKMTLMDRAKEVMREIMATHEPKPIPEEAKPKIAEIIARARARANGAT